MPEPKTIEAVTTVKVAPATDAPVIVHTLDKDNKPVVRGRFQYTTALIPAGGVVTVDIKVDGVVETTLGPWTAIALTEKNALAQVRLAVDDNCALDTLEPVEAEAG